MSVRACVVGSTNVDLVLPVTALPAPGETVVSAPWRREAGGKGANQAVALARLGADVRFVSAVGSDEPGTWSLEVLRESGLGLSDVQVVHGPTGQAAVLVDEAGENSIVVTPGANAFVSPPSSVSADVMLLSLEVPLSCVAAAAVTGRRLGIPVVLNAAPATTLPGSLLACIDVLVVNETEWEALGRPHQGAVVVTRGAEGCDVLREGTTARVAALPVDAVDTTGAGDCFAAALAFGVARSWDLVDAASFATRAAALSVTVPGARGGLPTYEQVLRRARG